MEHGVQRGAVQDMPLYPGDPLTPFEGATRDAERYTVEEAPTVMKIPVLPISYADALPLLTRDGGAGRAGVVARGAADHLPHRAGDPPGCGCTSSSTGTSRRRTTSSR